MVHKEQKLDQFIFIKLSHRDFSGGGWASQIVGGMAMLGCLIEIWGDNPLETMLPLLGYHNFHLISLYFNYSDFKIPFILIPFL